MESALGGRAAFAAATWRSAVNSRAAAAVMLAAFYWLVAAAAYSGFIGKWGLRDDSPRFSIDRVLDGTAQRPFVYRQLVPMLANAADAVTPEPLKRKLSDRLSPEPLFTKAFEVADPALRYRYIVVCYLAFVGFFAALFVLRRIVLDAGMGEAGAALAPAAFTLAFPYLQTVGGFYYDSVELLFFSIAFLLAWRGQAGWLIVLALPATLNKESFLFFIPALLPLLKCRLATGTALRTAIAAMAVSAAVNLAARLAFADAPGGAIEFHLFGSLASYLGLSAYHETEVTYGLIGPRGVSIVTLLVVATVACRGWPDTPTAIRRHLLAAAAINLPLFLLFGYPGELRNLSLLFVGAVVVIAAAVAQVFGPAGPRSAQAR
ncbi:MAG: hypothetical protein ACM3Y9_03580 [Ignavibacteria bacterium]